MCCELKATEHRLSCSDHSEKLTECQKEKQGAVNIFRITRRYFKSTCALYQHALINRNIIYGQPGARGKISSGKRADFAAKCIYIKQALQKPD